MKKCHLFGLSIVHFRSWACFPKPFTAESLFLCDLCAHHLVTQGGGERTSPGAMALPHVSAICWHLQEYTSKANEMLVKISLSCKVTFALSTPLTCYECHHSNLKRAPFLEVRYYVFQKLPVELRLRTIFIVTISSDHTPCSSWREATQNGLRWEFPSAKM